MPEGRLAFKHRVQDRRCQGGTASQCRLEGGFSRRYHPNDRLIELESPNGHAIVFLWELRWLRAIMVCFPGEAAGTQALMNETGSGTGAENPVASFSEYGPKLGELYTRFRYNKLIAHKLMGRALRIEKAVRWSVFVLLAISLFTGIFPGLNTGVMNRVWGSVTAAATLLTLYSLTVGSGEKQFRWFRFAAQFQTCASEVEFFSLYVKQGRIFEKELAERWSSFSTSLNQLLENAGPEFTDFESKHRLLLTKELEQMQLREVR